MNCELDSSQKKAVLTKEKNVLVVAAPGSGKTQVIINRTSELIKKRGVIPSNIIVITFTKAAAKNMKERYIKLFGRELLPFFGTFHGLFYKILSRYMGNIKIVQEYEVYRLIKNVLLKYMDEINDDKIREVINDISCLKVQRCELEEYKTKIDKDIFKECFYAYKGFKEENDLMDFDDLQLKCIELLKENEKLLRGYRKLFKHILVDEFQDVDLLQVEFLQMFDEESSIYAVGDEDQCIYSFRGSKPECMVKFDKLFTDGKKYFLNINYRSVTNIVDISKELIKNNEARNSKDINSFKKQKGNVTLINNKNENMQAENITLEIKKLCLSSDFKYSDIAILYRTNVESRSLIDSFIRKNIPFTFLDREYNFFEHFICKDIIAYLKLAINESDRESFFRIINKPFRYISKLSLGKVRNYPYEDNCFEILKSVPDIPVFQMKNIDKIKDTIAYLNKISLFSAVQCIISDLGYADYVRDYCIKYKMDVNEMNEIIEEFKSSLEGYSTILNFLCHVEEISEGIKNSKLTKDENRVILSTIHGVKGMEFKNVFIINCVEDNLPHKNGIEENLEEERRLFYVGITRAIDNLWLSITNEFKGSVRKPSRFIAECKLSSDIEAAYKKGELVRHASFGEGKIISIDKSEMEIDFSGVRRRFDTTVLVNCGLIKKA